VFEQPWLSSAGWDCAVIIAPAFISSLLVIVFRQQLEDSPTLPLWAWVSFVLLVDVAHVYASLFRTYFNPVALRRNKTLLIGIPLACWAVGCLLYSIDGLLFWRMLAYLAVFHFIRQQYGFSVMYSRRDPEEFRSYRWLDRLVIYAATIYPLLYWHTHLPRGFDWFVDGDFIYGMPEVIASFGLAIYAIAALAYICKEAIVFRSSGFFNVPRNLLIAGTALSWWVGIVMINSDFAFTLTNVLSHGIPYMGLIWIYHRYRRDAGGDSLARATDEDVSLANASPSIPRKAESCKKFVLSYAPVFFLFLVSLAYLEEGFWDGLVWREHLHFFGMFSHLPSITDPIYLAFLIPLLSLPQSTHYVLDGFIWRVKDRSNIWST
jgi:hypothetical protein